MDFHALRNIHNIPGLRVLEGILTVKNISFPHVVLAITSFLFQTPHAPPIFVFTSLPILIHLAESKPPLQFLLASAASIIPSLTASGLFTSWNLLSSTTQVISGQTALSTFVGAMTMLAVFLHRMLVNVGPFEEGSWEVTLAFGMIWAMAWLLFGSISDFGRYGVPSFSLADVAPLAPILRHLGTTGSDAFLGSAAYALYYTGGSLWTKREAIESDTLPTAYDHVHSPSTTSRAETASSRIRLLSESQSTRNSSNTYSTTDTSTTFTPYSAATDDRTETSTAPTSLSSFSRKRSASKKSFIGLAGIAAISTGISSFKPALGTTSDSIDVQTPLSLGFVLPRSKGPWRLGDLVHDAQTIGNSANLLVFPESAYDAYDKWDRQWAVDKMVKEVCQRYGVWVQLGIDTPLEEYAPVSLKGEVTRRNTARGAKKINEVILIGPEGEIGSYVKQKLIPYVESFPFHKGVLAILTWTINLPAPPGLNKTDWTAKPPYTRPIRISPLICLDSFHPDLLSSLDTAPDLFTISASALIIHIAERIVSRAASIALTHNAPVMVVAGSPSRMDQGISVILDAWGRTLMQQRGGRSVVCQVALPYSGEGEAGGSFTVGSAWLLGSGILLLGCIAAKRRLDRSARTDNFPMKVLRYLKGTVDAGEEGVGLSKSPKDPVTPPPRYHRSSDIRRSSTAGKGTGRRA